MTGGWVKIYIVGTMDWCEQRYLKKKKERNSDYNVEMPGTLSNLIVINVCPFFKHRPITILKLNEFKKKNIKKTCRIRRKII